MRVRARTPATTSWPPSSCSALSEKGVDLLHPRVRAWVAKQGWPDLRPIQTRAARALAEGPRDLIVAAGTAAGKTEAAFLPVASRLCAEEGAGIRALYVGPLKALINDQHRRLEELFEPLELRTTRWHGDAPQAAKKKLLADPAGVLLITPESLEALFCLHGPRIPTLFAGLEFVVVDEMHAFLGIERGRQLQSLLARLEARLGRRVARLGLSATLGDMGLAARFLRPREPESVELLVAESGGSELRLQLRGYRWDPAEDEEGVDPAAEGGRAEIARHLFRTLRGKNHLIFVNARSEAESYAALLSSMCAEARVPNEFHPHHGSLSREQRESLEHALREARRPVIALCTTTMEMGVDIGDVAGVAQLGAPSSVAGLRQRLGRSGRRGGPSVLRVYVREASVEEQETPLEQALHPQLVQAAAVLELLLSGWCEPADDGGLHLSTLVQQTLSMLCERGGAKAQELHRTLCSEGAFGAIDAALYGRFLRALGERELLTQMHDGTLLVGAEGERLVNHYGFYAAFESGEELTLSAGGRRLGQLPMGQPLLPGMAVLFGGRSWRVVAVDARAKTAVVEPGPGGRPPQFQGGGAPVHARVREAMWRVLASEQPYAYLDGGAAELLAEARGRFASHALAERGVLLDESNGEVLLFPWCGDQALSTLALQLVSAGLNVESSGIALRVSKAELARVEDLLEESAEAGPADALELTAALGEACVGKHGPLLSAELQALDYAAAKLDPEGAHAALERLGSSRAMFEAS